MRVNIRGKGVEITEGMENYIQEKSKSFTDKYFGDFDGVEIHAHLKVEKQKHFAEFTIFFHSYMLRGEAVSPDMYASIDEAFKNIETQYRKHKERLSRKNLKMHGMKEVQESNVEKDEDQLEIIRRKRFTLKPMNEEEAIMQMELLGHNFYVYSDDETNNIHVAYKRKEGHFGIIETEK
ncbi:MAG: ribosome-associated translation inhibitor RaiA [Firmicutes bacterium]|nr:ribosome-associated translation inhibitor RaiA [Bacillota bacterium]